MAKQEDTFLHKESIRYSLVLHESVSGLRMRNINGKSSLLLNICFWAVKYNTEMPCLDQAKKPLILYISQENSLEETVERMLSYVGATDAELKINRNVDESYDLIFKEFMESSPVELRMLYKPKNSISTADLDTIVNDIESEGEFEVKGVVHDYLKRIRPEVPSGDLRIDLGEAVNDFAVFAKNRKIPVISANQMNAAAYKVLEAGLEENEKSAEKKDLAKGLSITMQSESQMISENADAIFGINREFSKTLGKWFLTIKDLKNRGSKSNRDSLSTYFVHPFEINNSMRLQEDFNKKKPLSLNSVSDALEGFSKKEEMLPEKDYVSTDNSFFDDDEDLITS